MAFCCSISNNNSSGFQPLTCSNQWRLRHWCDVSSECELILIDCETIGNLAIDTDGFVAFIILLTLFSTFNQLLNGDLVETLSKHSGE